MRGQAVVRARRAAALERLKESKFFEKNGRTEESWQKRKTKEIENLEINLGIRPPRQKK